MDLDPRLESALRDANPRLALQKLLAELLETGHERDEIVTGLEAFRRKLVEAQRMDDDELILDLMDGFNGWCRG